MTEATPIDRCPRCQTPRPGAHLCDDCTRRLYFGLDRRRSERHRHDDDAPSPWQEIAIRLMEDQA
jgi:hypothetical protein